MRRRLFCCLACVAMACGSAAAEFPAPAELPVQDRLPGVLIQADGTELRDPGGWPAQRTYLKRMLAHYEYGQMPPLPEDVRIEEREETTVYGGAAVQILGVIPIRRNGRTVKVRIGIIRPTGKQRQPVIVKNDSWRFGLAEVADDRKRKQYTDSRRGEIEEFVHREAIRRGYAICKFVRTDAAADKRDSAQTGVRALYPEYDWGTIAAWAWMHRVVLSALEHEDGIDVSRNAATGHSRGGKTALCAGIYDERITVTAPNSSGTGGTGSARYFDPDKEPQTVGMVRRNFPYWFHERFYAFFGKEERMPFDSHTAKAAVAPRALFNAHARQDFHANVYGTWLTHEAAKRVYEWLGAGDRIALHWRDGGHNQNEEDWTALFDFCDWRFYGKKRPAWEANPYPGKYELQDRLPKRP